MWKERWGRIAVPDRSLTVGTLRYKHMPTPTDRQLLVEACHTLHQPPPRDQHSSAGHSKLSQFKRAGSLAKMFAAKKQASKLDDETSKWGKVFEADSRDHQSAQSGAAAIHAANGMSHSPMAHSGPPRIKRTCAVHQADACTYI